MTATLSLAFFLIVFTNTVYSAELREIYGAEICNHCSSGAAQWLCRESDDRLYEAGINKWLPFGSSGCRISDAQACSTCACDFYVKAFTTGTGSYNGWPRTTDGLGTGCVKSTSGSFCYFNDQKYALTSSERSLMCTSDAKKNSLAQLRHALCNNQCGI